MRPRRRIRSGRIRQPRRILAADAGLRGALDQDHRSRRATRPRLDPPAHRHRSALDLHSSAMGVGMTRYGELNPNPRILLGPGPTMADPRVLRAMSTPLLGQFDPEFTAVMNEVMELLRAVFQTDNERAFPVPGTGRAGLEAAMVSLLEPGDCVVVAECGRFGLLMIEIAERCGATVVPVRAEWGRMVEPEAVAKALEAGPTRM